MLKPLILVVEDNMSLLEGLKDLLEYAGYRVATASDGREALVLLDQLNPDLIVSDIMMPRIDGYQLHAHVRDRPELLEIPFIFLTARGEKDDIRRGKELGVDDYITKPFDEQDLLVAVRAKLSRWEEIRKLRDEQLAEMKQKILISMSHEFRTPLSYIITYSEMLETEGSKLTPEDFTLCTHGIRKGAARLSRLVEDFIKLVEIETGEAEKAYLNRRREIPDTSAWLRFIGRTYHTAAEEHGLQLHLEIPDGLPAFIADEAYLGDAIGRLLDNAIKFSKSDSEYVRLEADADDEKLLVKVVDQGIGIPENEILSLFNIFHQIDRAKQEQQGTGSGLAICKGIVVMHGGKVTVESQSNVGSTFTIELPLQRLED